MSYPEDEGEVGAVCPYLGLADDADSHATYATEAHRCYRLPNPTRIATTHQETYCLGANHPSCPVYQGEGVPQARQQAAAGPAAAAAPPSQQPPARPGGEGAAPRRRPPQRSRGRQPGALGPRPRSGGISMPVATIGLFALAIALVALAFIIQRALSGGDDEISPADAFETQQALNATQTAQAGGGNGETPEPGTTETPGTDETPATTTGTPEDGATATPTSGNGDGQTYTVQPGDTCSAIAQEFGTTVPAIIEANDLNEECEIFAEQVLTIP